MAPGQSRRSGAVQLAQHEVSPEHRGGERRPFPEMSKGSEWESFWEKALKVLWQGQPFDKEISRRCDRALKDSCQAANFS